MRVTMWLKKRNWVLAAVVAAMPARAAQDDAAHYARCLALSDKNPALALGDANAWSKAGGGAPAEHCAALALVGLKRYGEAAQRLDGLARAPRTPAAMRSAIFSQAGNAWMMAGDGRRAVASLQAALSLSTADPDVFADLGRAQAMVKNWTAAVEDLNAALAAEPRRADLLLLRGSAHRALHRYVDALKDLNAALALKPGDPATLLERGLLRKDAGDLGGARTDLAAAQRTGPPSVQHDAAEALDALK